MIIKFGDYPIYKSLVINFMNDFIKKIKYKNIKNLFSQFSFYHLEPMFALIKYSFSSFILQKSLLPSKDDI